MWTDICISSDGRIFAGTSGDWDEPLQGQVWKETNLHRDKWNGDECCGDGWEW